MEARLSYFSIDSNMDGLRIVVGDAYSSSSEEINFFLRVELP